MLAKKQKQHSQQISSLKLQSDILLNDAIKTVTCAAESYSNQVSSSVSIAFQNQKELEAKSKELNTLVNTYTLQTKEWLKLMHEFNNQLKELGDIQNSAEIIEKDVLEILSFK